MRDKILFKLAKSAAALVHPQVDMATTRFGIERESRMILKCPSRVCYVPFFWSLGAIAPVLLSTFVGGGIGLVVIVARGKKVENYFWELEMVCVVGLWLKAGHRLWLSGAAGINSAGLIWRWVSTRLELPLPRRQLQ
jgi:hypothetical protein